jgi:uncharacterized membrane protein
MAGTVNFNLGPNSPFKTITRLRRTHEQEAADAITRFSGTMAFVLLHVVWFGFWIIFNVVSSHPFDKFPFGLLTLIVSLEAIFLSTFVLMSQNQSARNDEQRERNDHLTDLYSEAWAELIGEKLGIDSEDVRKRYEQHLSDEKKNNIALDSGRRVVAAGPDHAGDAVQRGHVLDGVGVE